MPPKAAALEASNSSVHDAPPSNTAEEAAEFNAQISSQPPAGEDRPEIATTSNAPGLVQTRVLEPNQRASTTSEISSLSQRQPSRTSIPYRPGQEDPGIGTSRTDQRRPSRRSINAYVPPPMISAESAHNGEQSTISHQSRQNVESTELRQTQSALNLRHEETPAFQNVDHAFEHVVDAALPRFFGELEKYSGTLSDDQKIKLRNVLRENGLDSAEAVKKRFETATFRDQWRMVPSGINASLGIAVGAAVSAKVSIPLGFLVAGVLVTLLTTAGKGLGPVYQPMLTPGKPRPFGRPFTELSRDAPRHEKSFQYFPLFGLAATAIGGLAKVTPDQQIGLAFAANLVAGIFRQLDALEDSNQERSEKSGVPHKLAMFEPFLEASSRLLPVDASEAVIQARDEAIDRAIDHIEKQINILAENSIKSVAKYAGENTISYLTRILPSIPVALGSAKSWAGNITLGFAQGVLPAIAKLDKVKESENPDLTALQITILATVVFYFLGYANQRLHVENYLQQIPYLPMEHNAITQRFFPTAANPPQTSVAAASQAGAGQVGQSSARSEAGRDDDMESGRVSQRSGTSRRSGPRSDHQGE